MNTKTEILNAKISSVSLTMRDHGVLTFYLTLDGGGWGCLVGGYVIGHGYLGADEFSAENGFGLEAMMRIMDVVGVDRWEDLAGKFCRVESEGWGGTITTIGNILEDKWFDLREFFQTKQIEFEMEQEAKKREKEEKEQKKQKDNSLERDTAFYSYYEYSDDGVKTTVTCQEEENEEAHPVFRQIDIFGLNALYSETREELENEAEALGYLKGEDYFIYYLRGGRDWDLGEPCMVEATPVYVNYVATIMTKEPIVFEDGRSRHELVDDNDFGFSEEDDITVLEFLA